MPEINVEILPDGQVKISVEGAKGSECVDLTRFLEEALGEVQTRDFTPDYYQTEEKESIKVGEGGD